MRATVFAYYMKLLEKAQSCGRTIHMYVCTKNTIFLFVFISMGIAGTMEQTKSPRRGFGKTFFLRSAGRRQAQSKRIDSNSGIIQNYQGAHIYQARNLNELPLVTLLLLHRYFLLAQQLFASRHITRNITSALILYFFYILSVVFA